MSKGVIAAIIIAVLVVVGGGIAAAILLLGGDDDDGGGDSSSALGAAQSFTDAVKDGDCDAAKAVSTEKLAGTLQCDIPGIDSAEIGDPEITEESDTAATASVPVTVDGQDLPVTLQLVNQDGEWLVDAFNLGGGDLPTASMPSIPSFSLPSIPSFSLPSIPSFSLPSIPSFTIPSE